MVRRPDLLSFINQYKGIAEHFDLATSLQSIPVQETGNHVYVRSVCATLPFFEFRDLFILRYNRQ